MAARTWLATDRVDAVATRLGYGSARQLSRILHTVTGHTARRIRVLSPDAMVTLLQHKLACRRDAHVALRMEVAS